MVSEIHSKLYEKDRLFLLSFKEADPTWESFSVSNAQELPAIRWKLQNITKLKQQNPKKHDDMVKALHKTLFG